MTERWAPVPGYEGDYEVSTLGRVRSWKLYRGDRGPRILATTLRAGYPAVTLFRDGAANLQSVHAVVMLAFVGPRPEGHEIRHLDGDRTNACLTNLEYGTRSENRFDTVRHGRNHNATKTHCAQGHPFSPENTYVHQDHRGTHRKCRKCRNASSIRTRRKAA